MSINHVFFAGGGTGGHIYPAIAVAQQLVNIQPGIKITFFCSDRKIDSQILAKTSYDFLPLPAVGFSVHPFKLLKFAVSTYKSKLKALSILKNQPDSVVVGAGGFVSTGPVLAARKLKMPVAILNTDSVPGKANKFLAHYADEIYTQFEFSTKFFGPKSNVIVTGCPLRADFLRPDKDRVIKELKLDPAKKILLVTGASSGAKTINMAIGLLFDKLSIFRENWQIVHLSGKTDFESVNSDYINCPLTAKVLDYYDQMADLLACADLVIGRSGAVSVAEYAASGVVSICMPYPYHADNHQRINASQLESAGAAVIVDDKIDAQANAVSLWPVLESLMSDSAKLEQMRANARKIGKSDAAREIAKRILELRHS